REQMGRERLPSVARGSHTLPPRPRVQTSCRRRAVPANWLLPLTGGQERDEVGDLLVAERAEVPRHDAVRVPRYDIRAGVDDRLSRVLLEGAPVRLLRGGGEVVQVG